MRHARTAAAVVGVLLTLAGCSSSTSKPAAAPVPAPAATSVATTTTPPAESDSTEPAAPSETCATPLPDRGDIIVREIRPGLVTDAIELGGTDPEHCVLTFDSLQQTSPTGAGNCTQAAWASDNPGYDPSVTPAPPLKKVQVTVGDCG